VGDPRPVLEQTLDLFPTAVLQFSREDDGLDERLRSAVEELSTAEADGPKDRIGGQGYFEWQSRTDLQASAPFDRLADVLAEAADAYLDALGLVPTRLHLTELWANISRSGGSHAAHAHPNSFLSAVYFLTVPPGAGALQFVDPRPQAQVLSVEVRAPSLRNARLVGVEPKAGRLVVFPSWLTHRVDVTAAGDGEARVTLAANLMAVGTVGRPTMGYALEPPAR
jgi:uncharacterized protein (TIGR02466 family)